MTEKNTKARSQNFVVAYFVSAFEEFGKVTWPTKEQAAMLTAIVVAVGFVMAVLIGALDLGFAELYQLALKKFQ
jgi:preprotein translocase SecE subunit